MNPKITDDGVAGLPIHEGRAELLEEIMATTPMDVIDEKPDQPQPSRRHSRWLPAIAAAAAVAVVAAAAAGLLTAGDDEDDTGPAGTGGESLQCWDGSAGPTCSKPHGVEGLRWAFPRLAGRLDRCEPALTARGDDPPMPYGTPGAGDQGSVFRCDFTALGIEADGKAPRFWVYAFGEAGPDGPVCYTGEPTPCRDARAIQERGDAEPFSIGGEAAGHISLAEIGLVRPREAFLATYDDYPFGLMAFADDRQEALDFLAALGARKPSEMEQPGQVQPEMPDFPSPVLQAPSGSATP